MNNGLIPEVMTIAAEAEEADSQLVDLGMILYSHRANHL